MTQQQAQRANFGPTWPEVAGFGEGTPQQAVFGVFPQGKISKTCKCLDTCPACRLAERHIYCLNNSNTAIILLMLCETCIMENEKEM